MISTLAISGYRSLRDVVVDLGQLTVVTGANGAGKSNLYRALRLLASAAAGDVVGSLAREGGLSSTLWAGPEVVSGAMRRGEVPVQGTARADRVRLKVGFGSTDGLGYALTLGLPQLGSSSMFLRDPHIKSEHVFAGSVPRPAAMLSERSGPMAKSRGIDGWTILSAALAPEDSMLQQLADPERAPELVTLRESLRQWRFYDLLRTDPHAPARQPAVGTRTPMLASDGADLAAAVATILESGRPDLLQAAVGDAFAGSRLEIDVVGSRFTLLLRQPGMLRPLRADELSEGTLRYLLLAAALLSVRPPPVLVLNEPETSLHRDLIPPLARLIGAASQDTQVVVVSHDQALVEELAEQARAIELTKEFGETHVVGQSALTRPSWHWR